MFLVLATFCISVTADGVTQTEVIQGITISTHIDVIGSASNSVELAWTSSSASIQDSLPLTSGETVQTTVYSENTNAMNGHTVYVQDFSVNTGNQNRAQSNVKSSRQIIYEGLDGGNIVSDESLLISTAGMPTATAGQFLCPFGAGGSTVLPAFCNIVQAGSHVDSSYISLSTQAASRTIRATADVPVTLTYAINAHGINTANGMVPAKGLVSSYMKLRLQGGSGNSTARASDLTYEDKSLANGYINSFTKSMAYQSGANAF